VVYLVYYAGNFRGRRGSTVNWKKVFS